MSTLRLKSYATTIARPLLARRALQTSSIRLADPFVLPLDPSLSRSSSAPEKLPEEGEWPMPKPLDRTGEDEKTIRARLVYQSRKRGMLEGDLLLSTFARDHLGTMSMGEMREFDKLLDEPDWEIYYWSIDKREPPARWKDTTLLAKLRLHARNEGKVVRKMPDLMQQEPPLS